MTLWTSWIGNTTVYAKEIRYESIYHDHRIEVPFWQQAFCGRAKVKLVKEPDNEYDSEAIKAELPGLGCAGYVANSPHTRFWATASAPGDFTTKSETAPRPKLSMYWTMRWSAR